MAILEDSMIWLALSFLIFAFIVYKFGKAAFLSILDKRITQIKTELETAESLRIEAQEMLAQYQRKQRDAETEAETIIAKAEQHAIEIRKNAEAQLEETLMRREKQIKDRLTQMEVKAIQEIRTHAAALAVEATAQIIQDNLDKKSGEKLVDASVAAAASGLR